jgi:predicted nucleic acid-binding protein
VTVFADSSALVKLYADEEDHEPIRSITDPLVVSHLARVEVPAAFWRKERLGELSAADAALLTTAFEADFFGTAAAPARFSAVAAASPVLDDAARLVSVHRLRAYDAVQLASARHARAAIGDCDRLATFDAQLRDAAAAEGFTPVP